MVIDRETGRPRGFGYVNFAHASSVEIALTKVVWTK
jgi:RNA recognition motif-containing protein